MPNEADPKYAAWKPVLRQELELLEDGAIVIGHSVGGTMLIHVLAERLPQVALGALMLIAAPFIGRDGWPSDEIEPRDDFGARLPDELPVFLYHGSADDTVPISHLALYAKAIPRATTRRLEGRGHQLDVLTLSTREQHIRRERAPRQRAPIRHAPT